MKPCEARAVPSQAIILEEAPVPWESKISGNFAGAARIGASGAALPALAKGVSGEPIHWNFSTAVGSAGYQMSVISAWVFAPRQSKGSGGVNCGWLRRLYIAQL